MCPKTGVSLCERTDSIFKASRRHHKMTPALQSVFTEGKHDSGLNSMNLASINVTDMYNISCVEQAFSHMKINSGLQSCQQDSDTYTSRNDSGVYANEQFTCSYMSPDDVSIDTVCEMKCIDEDISLKNKSNCDNNTMCERDSNILTNIIDRLFEGDKDGDNRLHLSIINGEKAYSRLLINLAPEYDRLSLSNHLRQTPLHLAVLTQQPDIVRRLICAGATVLAQDKQGNTPLHIACRLGNEDVVKHLLTPVLYEEILENKYSIPYQRVPQDSRIKNYEGQTCLHIAVGTRNFEVVQMLLDAGADINAGDGKTGRSVLHLAANSGDTEMVEMLLSYRGINVKAKDYAGFTPTQLAYGRNHIETVKTICTISGQYNGIHFSEITLEEDVWFD